MNRAAIAVLASALALGGCATMSPTPSQPIAYAPASDGTVGLIGNQIGRNLGLEDRKAGLAAEVRALSKGGTGDTLQWRGQNGVAGAIITGPRYRVNDYDCREFTETVTVNDASETASATACRGTDGGWRVVG